MLDPIEQRVVEDIAEHGWHLIGVDQDREGPGFVYSIGMMKTLNHPEVIIFGLDRSLMSTLINQIGEEIKSGRPFHEPGLYDGILVGFACKIVPVAARFHEIYLGYAMWHRRYVGKIGTSSRCSASGRINKVCSPTNRVAILRLFVDSRSYWSRQKPIHGRGGKTIGV